MCAATIRMYRVPKVRYAAADPVWDGMHDLFSQLGAIAAGCPNESCWGGPWGAFAHVLHLSWLVDHAPAHVLEAHRTTTPQFFMLATRVAGGGDLQRVALRDGTVIDAATTVWREVEALVD